MHIDETDFLEFVEVASEKIPEPHMPEVYETRCPHCNEIIRLPLVARKRDLENLAKLIDIANEYLNEEDVPKKILTELMNKINKELNFH